MSDHKNEPQNDAREEVAFRQYLDRLGLTSKDRSENFRPFMAGWRARQEAAQNRFQTAGHDEDATLLRDYFEMEANRSSRMFNYAMRAWDTAAHWQKTAGEFRAQLRELRADPSDAPAWKRLTMQRKELKALNKLILILRGDLQQKNTRVDEQSARIVELEGLVYSNTTRGEKRFTWKELYEMEHEELKKTQPFMSLIVDLDRNEHGRHAGDLDSYDPTEQSQGNPHIRVGEVFAYDISGRGYVLPPLDKRYPLNITAWKKGKDA